MLRPAYRASTLRCSLVLVSAACVAASCGSEAGERQDPPAFSGDLLLPAASSPSQNNGPPTMAAPSAEASPSAAQPGAESEQSSSPQAREDSTPSIEGNIANANAPTTGNEVDSNADTNSAPPSDDQSSASDEEQPASEQPSAEAEPIEDQAPPVDEQPAPPPPEVPVDPPVVEEPVVEAPPAPGDVGSVFFSDSFEGTRRPEWEESLNGGGTFSLDASQGANGTGSSMRVDATGFHTMLQYPLPDSILASNQYFGRVHIRLEQAPQGHVTWIETGIRTQEFGRGNDEFEVRIGYNLGVLDLNRFPSDAEIRDPNTTIVPNQWHCVQFFFDGNPEEARVWFDGEETALSTTDFTRQREGAVDNNQQPVTGWIPPLEAIRFGWELNGNTIWIDEVALSTEFVDCQ